MSRCVIRMAEIPSGMAPVCAAEKTLAAKQAGALLVAELQDIHCSGFDTHELSSTFSCPSMPDRRVGGYVLVTPQGLRPYLLATSYLQFDARPCAWHVHLPADVHFLVLDLSQDEVSNVMGNCGLSVTILRVQAHAETLYTPAGRIRIAVASLTPMGMFAAFGARLPEDVAPGRPQPLESLCGVYGALQLAEFMESASTFAERALVFARWLEHRILTHRSLPAPVMRVSKATAAIMKHKHGLLDLGKTAQSVDSSRRQLERDFRAYLGSSPSSFARVVRFQRAAAALSSGLPISHAAADHGFVDQPHMTRSMRRLAQVTPLEIARDGVRPGRQRLRQGLGGRVFLFDVPPDLARAEPDQAAV
jgi:AraC-like DNA-binding protein